METLGTRLKALRKNKKITQQQVADAIGVSKTSVIYWEKDENLPKHDSLMALARVLGVTSDYLLNGKGGSSFDNNIKQAAGLLSNPFLQVHNLMNGFRQIQSVERMAMGWKSWANQCSPTFAQAIRFM